MPRYGSPRKLTFTEITPVLDAQERARRVETFLETMAKAAEVKGYVGCKYFPEQERGEIYVVHTKSKKV